MTPATARRALFAACKKLGLSDDDRRALQQQVTGKTSSREFTPIDWAKLIDHLNKLTGHTPAGTGQPTRWRDGCEAQGKKIAALLADQKLPWRYLTHGAAGKPSMVRRLAGVDRLEFADAQGLAALIAALSKRAAKQSPRQP